MILKSKINKEDRVSFVKYFRSNLDFLWDSEVPPDQVLALFWDSMQEEANKENEIQNMLAMMDDCNSPKPKKKRQIFFGLKN